MALGDSKIQPNWSQNSVGGLRDNDSFLSDTKRNTFLIEKKEWERTLFDPGTVRDLRRSYDKMDAWQEMRSNYHLSPMTGSDLPTSQADDRHNMQQGVVDKVKDRQRREYVQRLRVALERDHTIQTLRTPLAVVFGVTAFLSGEPLNTDFHSAHLYAKAEASHGKLGGVVPTTPDGLTSKLTTSFVDTSMEYRGNIDSTVATKPDLSVTDERYRFTVSRQLPIWSLSSGVSYGSSTQTMRTSVSRPIWRQLVGTVESARPVGAGALSEQLVKVNYGLNF